MTTPAKYEDNPFDGPAGLGEHTRALKDNLLQAYKLAVEAVTAEPEKGDGSRYDPVLAQDTLCHFMADAVYRFVKDFIESELEANVLDDSLASGPIPQGGNLTAAQGVLSDTEVGEFEIDDPLGGRPDDRDPSGARRR